MIESNRMFYYSCGGSAQWIGPGQRVGEVLLEVGEVERVEQTIYMRHVLFRWNEEIKIQMAENQEFSVASFFRGDAQVLLDRLAPPRTMDEASRIMSSKPASQINGRTTREEFDEPDGATPSTEEHTSSRAVYLTSFLSNTFTARKRQTAATSFRLSFLTTFYQITSCSNTQQRLTYPKHQLLEIHICTSKTRQFQIL